MHPSLKDISLKELSQEEKSAVLYNNVVCDHCFDTQILVDTKGNELPCFCK